MFAIPYPANQAQCKWLVIPQCTWGSGGGPHCHNTVHDYGGVEKVPLTLDLVKAAKNSYRLYNEHSREEQAQ